MHAQPVVKSADRVVDILELLASEPQGLTVAELGARLGIARSSTHGLVHTLLARGYLGQESDGTKKVRLGARLIQLGLNVCDQVELRSAARPALERLVSATRETALLVVPEQGELLYVDKVVSSAAEVRADPRMSARRPFHSTSLGKALLASLDDETAAAVLEHAGMSVVTEFTITSRRKLLADLVETRRRGYAVDRQEAFLGVCCVGAPIRDHTRRPVASLSLSTVTGLFDPERTGPQVTRSAVEISRALGWTGDGTTLYEPVPGSFEALVGPAGAATIPRGRAAERVGSRVRVRGSRMQRSGKEGVRHAGA
jgi:DNA-binding IclR family transcriptional regulator